MFNLKFKKFKKIFNFSIFNQFYNNCNVGWVALILFFIILNLNVIFFSIFLYSKIDKREIFIITEKTDDKKKTADINKEDLNKIIYNFTLKSDSFEKLKQEKGFDIIDPSR